MNRRESTLENFTTVILDMDGVLTRTARVHARAWKQMFDEFLEQRAQDDAAVGKPFDIDRDYRRFVDGKPRYAGVKSFLGSRGIDLPFGAEDDGPEAQTVCGLGNRKNRIFHELLDRNGVQVYEDALEQIENWKRRGMRIAAITSSRNGRAVLEAAEILGRFDVVIDGNDMSDAGLRGKPAPDIFLEAARKLNSDPARTIVVEDAIAGVQAGRAGRFGLVAGVARDGDAESLRQAGADRVVHDVRELDADQQDQGNATTSALADWDAFAGRLRDAKPALFLDYDGTLTPIARRPEEAVLSQRMRSLLTELADCCTVAIISGRDRQNVEQMVGVANLVYAGSHGFDIRGPGGLEMEHEEARQSLPDLDDAERQLRQKIGAIEGAHVERKRFAIAVHYREVQNEEDLRRVEEVVDNVLAQRGELRKRDGKRIFELQPDVDWDKGRAVLWLAEAFDLDRPHVALLYVGDDVTDEDAFRVLRDRRKGISVRVGSEVAHTQASYHLRDCDEVAEFLNRLLATLQETASAES